MNLYVMTKLAPLLTLRPSRQDFNNS